MTRLVDIIQRPEYTTRMAHPTQQLVNWVHAAAVIVTIMGGPALAEPDSSAEVSATPRLGLDDFLRRVRANSPGVAIARASLDKYLALFDEAYYAWTPRLKIDALLVPLPERRLLQECVVRDGYDYDGRSFDAIQPCPGQNIEDDARISADTEIGILVRTKVRVTFPIYTFGKIDSAQRAARAGVEIGEAGIEYARGELDFLVKKAYYGSQLARSALDILDDGRTRMRGAKGQIEKELEKESGKFTSNDLRKLLVEQAELESSFLETGALSRVAWEGLRIAGGFKPGAAFELDTNKLTPVHVEARTIDEYLEIARAQRPDLWMAEAAVRAREGQVDMAAADFYPDIALVAEFGFAKGTSADDNPDPFANDPYNSLTWGAVLAAEWRLDFATRMSKLRQAEAAAAKQRAERDALAQKVRLGVVELVESMKRYKAEVGIRQVAMKAGKGWLVSNSLNFGMGLATTDELLSSLIAYSKARLKYYQAIYEYNLAVARLTKAVGTELSVPTPKKAVAE